MRTLVCLRKLNRTKAFLSITGLMLAALSSPLSLAQDLSAPQPAKVSAHTITGFSAVRDRMVANKRPMRILAIYSERAIATSDAVKLPINLLSISSEKLQAASRLTGETLKARGISNIKAIKGLPLVAFTADAEQLTAIAESGQFAAVVEDRLAKPYLQSSGNVMNVPAAQAAGALGAGKTVAILDTGVDTDHPFLNGRVVEGACFSSTVASTGSTSLCPNGANSATTLESGNHCTGVNGCDHGTHVAGIAAGKQTASINLNGVAPEANILAIQVFSRFDDRPGGPSTCASVGTSSPCVLSYTSDQLRGLQHVLNRASDLNIVAANMSLGGGEFSGSCDAEASITKSVIDSLLSAGVATVIAAGNDAFRDAIGAPGCISTAVTVGSTTDRDNISSFSNLSDTVDLLAVGSRVDSSVPGTGTANFNGTSMAAPQIAGAYAALASLPANPSVEAIFEAIQSTGVSITDSRSGGSITKARMNLAAAANTFTTSPNPMPDEDCVGHNIDNLRLTRRGWWFWSRWLIADGDRQLFSFGRKRNEAQQALDIIRRYGFTNTCYIGRPNASMQYLRVGSSIPNNSNEGIDCVGFNPATTQLEQSGSTWRAVDGDHWIASFPNQEEAQHALAVIRHYNLNRQCFVGRPDPSFTFWLAE